MTDPLRAARAGRWAVAAMFLVNGFALGAWAPQIPLLMPRHGITEAVLGLLIPAISIGALAASLVAGRLIQRLGARRMITAMGLAMAPSLALVVLAPSLGVIVPALLLMGFTGTAMDIAMNAGAVAVERRLGRPIMSSMHGFWSIGGFVGGLAGSWAVARFGPEIESVAAGALAALVVLAASGWLIADPPPPPTPVAGDAKGFLLPRVALLYLLGAMGILSMVPQRAVLDWAAIFLSKGLGADLQLAGLGFALFSAAMAVTRFLGDGLRHRFGAVGTLRVSGLIGLAGLGLAALSPSTGLAISGFALAGLGMANMVPILFSAAGNARGLTPGAGIAVVALLSNCGMLIAPSVIGLAAEAFGFRVTFLALGLALAVVAGLAGKARAADLIQGH